MGSSSTRLRKKDETLIARKPEIQLQCRRDDKSACGKMNQIRATTNDE